MVAFASKRSVGSLMQRFIHCRTGFPLRNLSVRDFLRAEDDVLLAGAGPLSFCAKRVRLLRHQIVPAVLGRYSALRSGKGHKRHFAPDGARYLGIIYLAATAFHLRGESRPRRLRLRCDMIDANQSP